MEELDRVSARVSLSTLLGFVGGATLATWKGHSLRSTSIKVAASCALVSTTLFCTERLSHLLLLKSRQVGTTLPIEQQDDDESAKNRYLYSSHAIAGIVGGGFNGQLYVKRPIQGMVLFVPIMMGVAFAEIEWDKIVQRRRREIANKQKENGGAMEVMSSSSSIVETGDES